MFNNEDFENWLTDAFFRRLERGGVDVQFQWERIYSPHETVDGRAEHCGLFPTYGHLPGDLINNLIDHRLHADEQIYAVERIYNEIDEIIRELNAASIQFQIKFYIFRIHLSTLFVDSQTMEPQHTVLIRGFEMPHNYSKNYTPKPKNFKLPTA